MMIHLIVSHDKKEFELHVPNNTKVQDVIRDFKLDHLKYTLVRGGHLSADKTLADCNIQNGERLAIAPLVNGIFIKTLRGETVLLENLSPQDSVQNVIDHVAQREKFPSEQIGLVHGGTRLCNQQALSDCCIGNGATLHMALSLKGDPSSTSPFIEVNCAGMTNFDANAPTWRTARPGLNLVGVCNNQGCTAFQQSVVIPRGFGTFHIGAEIRSTQCPMCNAHVTDVSNSVLYECAYSIEGEMSNVASGNAIVQHTRHAPRASEGIYHAFNEWKTSQSWYYLKLTVSHVNGYGYQICKII